VLVLALIFMVSTALVVGALASWTANDVQNIGHFKTARTALYAADAAMQTALSGVRYQYQNFSTTQSCGSSTDPFALDGWSIVVLCGFNQTPNEGSSNSRVVNVNAYLSSQVCGTSPCNAATAPLIAAQVIFNDLSSPGLVSNCPPTPPTSQSTCGTGMTVNSWVVKTG
jgi:hypothetical protein